MKKIFGLIVLFAAFLGAGSAYGYTVKSGDTFCGIAQKVGISCGELKELNPRENFDLIFPGEQIDTDGQSFGAVALPEDGYDTYLTSAVSASASTIYVSELPTVSESIYTIFASDGSTVSEKVYCTGKSTSPNRLTGCVRGLSQTYVNGVIDETAGTGVTHSKNSRIAITDNVNFLGKALNILSGNQPTSSTAFILGNGTSTTIKMYLHKTSSTTTDPFIGWLNTGKAGWSDNGTDTFNFADGSSGLTASSTRAIGIDNSAIYVNASTTRGFDFDANGALYLKDGDNSGIYFDSNGIAVERYDTYNWEGAHKFGSNLNVSSTFQSTQPLTVFSNSSSSTLPRIATDYISATTTGANVTTTVVNNLQVNGNIDATGQNFAKSTIAAGQGSQPVNTTGNQVITHNLGFIPSLITIQSTNVVKNSDIGVSFGNATSISNETCTYMGHISTSGSGTQASGQTSSIICLSDSAGAVYARATLDAMDATTFTLNWVANGSEGSARGFQWEVYR